MEVATQNDIERLKEILDSGVCCASALAQLGLELLGEKNERLLQAMSGLCFGVHSQMICGALTGAACLMNVLDPTNANTYMIPELVQRFAETTGEEYGGICCKDILGPNPITRQKQCNELVIMTYKLLKEIMTQYGYDFC